MGKIEDRIKKLSKRLGKRMRKANKTRDQLQKVQATRDAQEAAAT